MNTILLALRNHARLRLELEPQDLFKFLYQAVFGCEHLIAAPEQVIQRIHGEEKSLPQQKDVIEPLGEDYCRVPLFILDPKTLGNLFYRSAQEGPKGTPEQLEKTLDLAAKLVQEGHFSFDFAAFSEALAQWKAQGYPALHHSPAYREAYRPAYRVVESKYLPFLPLLARLDQTLAQKPVILAIEGGSASGKSTLGALLEQLYGCTLLHMDDFFLRPEQRTPARLAEPGGNVDRERFSAEVLTPLSQNQPLAYRRFDCTTGTLLPAVRIFPQGLTVIEGVYSMHPELAKAYDLSVFLKISPKLQKKRIEKRNTPPMAERFFKEWIPLERRYFEALQVQERCTLTIEIR